MGGGMGVLLAINGLDLLLSFSPADLPRAGEVGIDSRMLLFSLVLSLLAGFVFGLAPAMRATKADLNAELKEGGGSVSGAASRCPTITARARSARSSPSWTSDPMRAGWP